VPWQPPTAATVVLWSQRDDLEDFYGNPLVIWRDWADDVRGHSVDSGTTWPRKHPTLLLLRLATFSPTGSGLIQGQTLVDAALGWRGQGGSNLCELFGKDDFHLPQSLISHLASDIDIQFC